MPSEASVASTRARPPLCWLDWLRFLAALVVLVDHTRDFQWDGYTTYRGFEHPVARIAFISLFSLGKQAVVLFFVLSGWLVGGHTIQKLRAGKFDASAYAADRLARVYVPLLPALLLTLAIVRVLDGEPQTSRYVFCLFGLQNVFSDATPIANMPLWTLGYEIWFYVLAGCAAVACRRESGGARRLMGLAGAALAVWVCCAHGRTYLACWLLGAAGFWVRERIAPSARWATLSAGTLLLAAGAAVYQIRLHILPPLPPAVFHVLPSAANAQLIVAAGSLLLIASVVSTAPKSPVGRRIERTGAVLAAFSYTLYLTHFPVLLALRVSLDAVRPELTVYSVLRAFSWMAVCFAVALIMYALFERQTPRVRQWLRQRLGRTSRADTLPGQPVLAAQA